VKNFAIGVDLGGTNLRIAAVDEQGTLVEKVTLGTKVSLGRDHVIADMCEAIQRLLEPYQERSHDAALRPPGSLPYEVLAFGYPLTDPPEQEG